MSFWDDYLNSLAGATVQPPIGTTMNNTTQSPAPPAPAPTGANTSLLSPFLNSASGAYNNIYNTSAAGLAAMRKGVGGFHPSTWGQQISDEGAIEGGNPAVAQPVSSGKNPAPTLPQPTITLPPFTAHAKPGAPQAAQPPGPQPYGSPWDPQGVGYARSWDPQGVAAAAAARMPPQGALAAPGGQQPDSPFTMVLSPNAPANTGGRGRGGTAALGTALDLSGYRPPVAPPAPPTMNLGYGGPATPPTVAIPKKARAQVPTNWALPQLRPQGASAVVPTWSNPAYGAGANVGLGN